MNPTGNSLTPPHKYGEDDAGSNNSAGETTSSGAKT